MKFYITILIYFLGFIKLFCLNLEITFDDSDKSSQNIQFQYRPLNEITWTIAKMNNGTYVIPCKLNETLELKALNGNEEIFQFFMIKIMTIFLSVIGTRHIQKVFMIIYLKKLKEKFILLFLIRQEND
jgi:hypothetical protein